MTGSLATSGVAPGEVRSTAFSVAPTFTPTGGISGYQVSNTQIVTLHDLVHAGQVIDTAAVAHARAMARAAATSLRDICSISDTTTGLVPLTQAGFVLNSAGPADHPVPLEPGTQQATAQVTVVYALGTG